MTKKYQLDDGTVTTIRAHYIRQEFLKNRTRREIADELDISYGIVAQATLNMTNKRLLDKSRIYVTLKDGRTIPRTEYIREQILNKGKTISEVAGELNISYDSAYYAVKGIEGIPKKHHGKVIIDWEGQKVYRVDVIRKLYSEGYSIREISDTLDCDYAIVYNSIYKYLKK